jgi:RNA polymerase sigma-70 factor, ECF subfamily
VEPEKDVFAPRTVDVTTTAPVTFDALFEELHDRLYRALFFVTGSSADAEELAQDAFLKLWERWGSIDSIEDPTAWLFRVALNGFRSRLRHVRVATRRLLPGPPPPDLYDEIELREDVRQMLLSLPARQRAALVLTEIFGYSSEDAGAVLGIRATTVRVLASQGRAALRAT